jgi:DNA-binding SARP family transcriptional activator
LPLHIGVDTRSEIWAFGPVAFAVGGIPLPLRGKPATLLALLSFYGGAPVHHRLAAETLWDRAALPPDPSRALRQVIRRLNPVLAKGGSSVLVSNAGLALDLPADSVDVLRFRRMLESRPLQDLDESELRNALVCWTADPFPELLHVPEVQAAVDRLVDLRLDAFEALCDIELRRPVSYPLVAELERMVRLHPDRECLWQQLAKALHRCSRRVEALHALDRCKRAMMGSSPSPATLQLERDLLHDRRDTAV